MIGSRTIWSFVLAFAATASVTACSSAENLKGRGGKKKAGKDDSEPAEKGAGADEAGRDEDLVEDEEEQGDGSSADGGDEDENENKGPRVLPPWQDRVVTFVATYTYINTGQANGGDAIVMIGKVGFQEGGKAKVQFSQAGMKTANSMVHSAPPHVHAEMTVAPGFKKGCAPGPILIPAFSSFNELEWTWANDGDDFHFGTADGSTHYGWTLQDEKTGRYALTVMHSPYGQTGATLGYAYLTDKADEPLYGETTSREKWAKAYLGHIDQNNNMHTTAAKWLSLPIGIYPGTMNPSADKDVFGYTSTVNDASSVYAHYSILFNHFEFSRTWLAENGGHDFDNNGCMTLADIGHSRIYAGVIDLNTKKVTKAPFVEISRVNNTPLPIFGVGWVEAVPDKPDEGEDVAE